MAVSWTEDQKLAIHQSEKNILVSAAAGSGKTAVLVERIMRIITDPRNPVDVDRLLIVTFTKAAAAEMKDRIGKALEERLSQDPENEHLQQQGILLHHAQISTIHGFCTYVIQNYFHQIGLDPGYRIAEESELAMMKRDVLEDVLEEEYAKEEEDFLHFIESFAPGKSDRAVEELILRLYEFSVSDPDPKGWLKSCLQVYEMDSEEEISNSLWLKKGMTEGRSLLEDVRDRIQDTLELAMGEGGPWEYIPQIEADLQIAEGLLEKESYGELVKAFSEVKHPALSRKKMAEADPKLKDQVKENRDAYKAALKKIGEQYFGIPVSRILEEIRNCRVNAAELVRLTELFSEGFAEKKRKNNVLDFSDLEHFALEILLEKQGEGWKRRTAARELSQQYYEIMIDEYQDSNFIQEALLRAVSGEEEGRFNRFMVGDIKQSVYGFRQAKPELFLEKYHTYGREENCTRIDLKQNFRSREQMLSTANALFRRLMVPSLGGIEYDSAAALHLGFGYPEVPEGDCSTEMILIDGQDPDMEELTLKEDRVEMEALAVAQRIRELMETQPVYDRKTESFRPATYKDFAILLRSFTGKAEVFLRVLKNEGIPAFAVSKSGYFSTIEISTVLNYLRLLDNPRQDIPYAAVLRSPIGGVTDEELALIRCAGGESPLFEAVPLLVASYLAFRAGEGPLPEGILEELLQKLTGFVQQLEQYRDLVPQLPVHELLNLVLEGTGYRCAAGSLPMGEQRLANLNLLVEKAVDFENTSYHGLFQFLRYIQQMEKNRIDMGEVNLYGETADAVAIMTIHKSKGLEYPFVFVSCLDGKFNTMDMNKSIIFHPELGLGMNYVDPEKRVRHSTMIKGMVAQRLRQELLAEELRVLYVALTRAKEKLILTAIVDNLEKRVKECEQTPSLKEKPLPYGRLMAASSYLDWLLPVIAGTEGFQSVYQMFLGQQHPKVTVEAPVAVRIQTPAAMTLDQLQEALEREALHGKICSLGQDPQEIYAEEVRAFLQRRTQWSYPWEYRKTLPSVMSVSELKKKRPSQSEEEIYVGDGELPLEKIPVLEYSLAGTGIPETVTAGAAGLEYSVEEQVEDRASEEKSVAPEEGEEVYLPAFMRQKEAMETGVGRGTAYHRFFECVEYGNLCWQEGTVLEDSVREQIKGMVSDGRLEQEEADCLELSDLTTFFESGIGQRMGRAAAAGRLMREKSFLMELPAVELNPEWNVPERILVRGVIDACFLEEGEFVLVDYKTDRVWRRDGRELVNKYAKQLQFYQRALEKGSGIPVKERVIYSVSLGKEIAVPAINQYNKD
ncbi:MAG: helicase-exonuclease AddAB subunit AddA [Lachnospiraceae bacterium]|nr:helicase-exonuclease AddAB subunit AddA [Lachnospiraceae bacterium]